MQAVPPFRLDRSDCFALFENNLDSEGQLFVLHDLAFTIGADTAEQLNAAFTTLDEAKTSGLWLAVAIRYEAGFALEPRLAPLLPTTAPLLRAWAFRCREEIAANNREEWWQNVVGALLPQQRESGILALSPQWSEAQHAEAVERILNYIEAGDCYQVNLTFPFKGLVHGHPLALFARLRETQPVRYGALIHDGSDWILSRSPELFFSRHDGQIVAKPMKGTIARAEDPQEDAARKGRLQASQKDRAENLMIVDLIRNDLGRLVQAGGVKVTRLFEVEAYRTVYQLTSTITASPVYASDESTFKALFPCGSVTGAPKIRAMEIIHELETGARGVYCGALGWMAPNGQQCFSVPIRTLLVQEDGSCRLDVGGGIVADSIPAAEYEECLAKAAFVSRLVGDFSLIETLLWSPDKGISLFELHLKRLGESAAALGFLFDEASVRARISSATAELAGSQHRIRLLLSHDGRIQTESAPLAPLAGTPRVMLWPAPLDERDPKLRFKTTARSFYDQALKQAIEEDCFDALFFNRRGELCEGGRSNVYLEIDGELLTPSRSCGLLPGVFRQHLIDESRTREATLTLQHIRRASRIFLSNALRGLFEVRLKRE